MFSTSLPRDVLSSKGVLSAFAPFWVRVAETVRHIPTILTTSIGNLRQRIKKFVYKQVLNIQDVFVTSFAREEAEVSA